VWACDGSGDCSGLFPKTDGDPASVRYVAYLEANDLPPVFSLLAAQPATKQNALNLVYPVLRTYKEAKVAKE